MPHPGMAQQQTASATSSPGTLLRHHLAATGGMQQHHQDNSDSPYLPSSYAGSTASTASMHSQASSQSNSPLSAVTTLGGGVHTVGSGSSALSGLSPSSGSDDGTILFIGDLSRVVKEEELHLLFAPFGSVVAIDIKRDRLTLNNLGYGFVQFSSRADAAAAKKALNGFELAARKIRIGWAQKNTTIFVGDLDGTVTTEDLIRVFEAFGTVIAEESFVKEPSRKYVSTHSHTLTTNVTLECLSLSLTCCACLRVCVCACV